MAILEPTRVHFENSLKTKVKGGSVPGGVSTSPASSRLGDSLETFSGHPLLREGWGVLPRCSGHLEDISGLLRGLGTPWETPSRPQDDLGQLAIPRWSWGRLGVPQVAGQLSQVTSSKKSDKYLHLCSVDFVSLCFLFKLFLCLIALLPTISEMSMVK